MESHRLKQRTLYDIEMIEETGFCKGIENYSRHFDGRERWASFKTKLFKLSEMNDYSMLNRLRLNALLNDNIVIMDKERKFAITIPHEYDNYYEARVDGFTDDDIQINLFEKSPWDARIADIELIYE